MQERGCYVLGLKEHAQYSTCPPELVLVACITNIPVGFEESLKYTNFVANCKATGIHILWWLAESKEAILSYFQVTHCLHFAPTIVSIAPTVVPTDQPVVPAH